MARRNGTSRRTMLGAFLFAAGLSAPFTSLAINSQHLANLADLDGFVSATYDGFTNDAAIYPSGPFHFGINCGMMTFPDGGDISALTNALNTATVFGVTVFAVSVVETQDATRVWLCLGTNGVPVHTNAVPAGFDPEAWVRLAYRHDPPEYLSGTNLAQWYADRDRSRLCLTLTLVNSNDWATIQAAEEEAATNAPGSGATPPTLPPDTNNLAFAGIESAATATKLWVYTPASRPVAIFTREDLLGPASGWTYAGCLGAVPAFNLWQSPAGASNAFYHAGFLDVDTDGDGLPDAMERLALGTDPAYFDTTGGSLGDYYRLLVYGLAPLGIDSDGDGLPDEWAILNGFNPLDAGTGDLDPDGDGLVNRAEYLLGTNPKKSSSYGSSDLQVISPFHR